MVDPETLQICSICGGSGWQPVKGKGVKPCECRRAARIEHLLRQARIPARYQKCSFDTLEVLSPSLERALMYSKKFTEEYPLVEVGLLYLGRCGVGKTHLAVSVLNTLIRQKGITGLFCDFRELLKEIQDSYNPNTQTSELRILSPLYEAELLVLDELGASVPTQWVQETMTYIINRRYNDRKITIFTSNYQDVAIMLADGKESVGPMLNRIAAEVAAEIAPVHPGLEDEYWLPRLEERARAAGIPVDHRILRAAARRVRDRLAREETLTDRIGTRLRSRLHEMCRIIFIDEPEDYRKRLSERHRRGFSP